MRMPAFVPRQLAVQLWAPPLAGAAAAAADGEPNTTPGPATGTCDRRLALEVESSGVHAKDLPGLSKDEFDDVATVAIAGQ
mmetsp:Transcript_38242/g.95941  ORF Transcript_38242/g.95941 Transcript_38242/m.95941 type:complete len:81 (-) Transcript_38242:89-331(-)